MYQQLFDKTDANINTCLSQNTSLAKVSLQLSRVRLAFAISSPLDHRCHSSRYSSVYRFYSVGSNETKTITFFVRWALRTSNGGRGFKSIFILCNFGASLWSTKMSAVLEAVSDGSCCLPCHLTAVGEGCHSIKSIGRVSISFFSFSILLMNLQLSSSLTHTWTQFGNHL